MSDYIIRYTGQDFIANVAFDIFTASTADGAPEYEFMIVSVLAPL
jgi:hypothetical protein